MIVLSSFNFWTFIPGHLRATAQRILRAILSALTCDGSKEECISQWIKEKSDFSKGTNGSRDAQMDQEKYIGESKILVKLLGGRETTVKRVFIPQMSLSSRKNWLFSAKIRIFGVELKYSNWKLNRKNGKLKQEIIMKRISNRSLNF